jgi:hypothetical protein
MTVLDAPRVDTIILDETILNETILDDDPGCQSAQGCDKTADWSCVMRCCGQSSLLCDPCVGKARMVADGRYITCADCRHCFGFARFETIVRTVPL